MSTRSNIGYKDEDSGKYVYVYCHFDGYEDGVGMDLLNNYNSYDKIIELVNQGDMSTPGTPYTSRGDDYEDTKPQITFDINETYQQEFSYIWRENKIVYSKNGKTWKDLK